MIVEEDKGPYGSIWEARLGRAGRNAGPLTMWQWWVAGSIPLEEFRRLLPEVWTLAEWPAQLGQRVWLDMFRSAGFITDCGAVPPTESVTVYRGATRRYMRGFSWSDDVRQAAWFADRPLRGGPGHVFEVTVKPSAVLGIVLGRNEPEVILNPNTLRGSQTPIEVPDAPRYGRQEDEDKVAEPGT